MAHCRSLVVMAALTVSSLAAGLVHGAPAQPVSGPGLRPEAGLRSMSFRTRAPEGPARRDEVIDTEEELRAAWADPLRRRIDLGADILLRDCALGDPIRESPYPLVLDGHGHVLQQTCFEKRLLRQDGTGYLDIRRVTLTRGGSDGPGAALTSRGEVMLRQVVVFQNLAEEPGGGVFSMRRITVHRSRITGNLANDDGGGLYARRGGVQVYDSILGNNLVDGSGGAIGSTGDILVVRSEIDGNTTDGDGGALYADEDGDVTVIGSHIDGSAADGPGGAIFTLDGDVAVYDSTLIGNRADDRGGAVAGEDDVLIVNSTVARNLAVAHAGGGLWARGDMVLVNATVANNYAEGEGGGMLSAGAMSLLHSTVVHNIAPVGGDLGAGGRLTSVATIIGPPVVEGVTGDTIATRRSCRVYEASSRGFNFINDDTCHLNLSTDILGEDPQLEPLEDDPRGFVLVPSRDSPVRRALPGRRCVSPVSWMPRPLPAGQLLDGWVDWEDVLAHDAQGRARTGRTRCDIGAAQSGRSRPSRPRPDVPPIRVVLDPSRTYDDAPRVPTAVVEAGPRRPAGPGRHGSARAQLARLDRALANLQVRSRRFEEIESCVTEVGVVRRGDPRHRWGYQYDERDHSGRDLRPALALAHQHRPDWRLLDLRTTPECLSRPSDPRGSGEDARVVSSRTSPRHLVRWLERLELVADEIGRQAQRFDQWESCLVAVPTTEAGAAWQRLGYLTGRSRYRAAIDLDMSEWDDPDYQLLAFRGRTRPFGGADCDAEPSETADRARADRSTGGPGRNLRESIASLRADVEDLVEPVAEITQFDECVYTVGASSSGGYRYQNWSGRVSVAGALSFAMRGPRVAPLQLLVFPGEEPPQIECNEDASSAGTEE
ncbi:hypothetical protein [Nocardioides oleivorans]|uniref:hypothetical protein n=1 Tax=Nocardioides oleivorans TaxID=273676 RepID=UPI0013EADD31|nr:hypothetical protein [Nocardioides oleivorans]